MRSKTFKKFYNYQSRKKITNSYYSNKINLIKNWLWKDTEKENFYYDLEKSNIEHMIHMISVVLKKDFNNLYSYVQELRDDSYLRRHLIKAHKESNYPKDTKIEYGRRIGWYVFARAIKPRLIIETGVHNGVGACILSAALMRNNSEGFTGRYIGTEIDKNMGQFLKGSYKEFGSISYGDSIETLKGIDEEIDLFINDSDHSGNYEFLEYQAISNKLSENAVILGDNSHVTNSLIQFSKETKRDFLFFQEKPLDHWYPGAGIGISF